MNRLAHVVRHRSTTIVLLGTVVLGGSLLASAFVLRTHLRNAERELRARRTELAKLHAVQPARGSSSENDLAVQLTQTAEQLRRRAVVWTSPQIGAGEDTLLRLAEDGARLRRLARESGVTLAHGERFGFSDFSRLAPPEAEQARVARQRRFVGEILAASFAAGVAELLEVKRAPATGADRFELRGSLSGARPGFLDSTALRVTFLADTNSLRRLLNTLAAPDARCLVLAVDAHAVPAPESAGSRRLRVALTIERLEAAGDFAGETPGAMHAETVASLPSPWKPPLRSTSLFGEPPARDVDSAVAKRSGSRHAFPLKLVRVEPLSARVELLGSCELRGEVHAVVRDRSSGAVSLLVRGRSCPRLEVELLEFQEATISGPSRACLHDLRSGAEIQLGGTAATHSGAWQAVISPVDPSPRGPERIVTVGACVAGDDGEYRVAAISANPPVVELLALTETNPPTANVRLEITP